MNRLSRVVAVFCTLALGTRCTDPAAPAPIPALATITVAAAVSSLTVGQVTTASASGIDQDGAPIATGPVVWSATPQVTIDQTGVIVAVVPGPATVTATAGDKVGQVVVTVMPQPPAALALTTPLPSTAVNRSTLAQQPAVRLVAANGSTVTQPGIVVTASVSAGGIVGTSSVMTDASGVALFTDFALSGTAGNRTVTFSAPNLTPALAAVVLTAGAPAAIAVNAGNQQTTDVGTSVRVAPSVLITDVDSNPVPGVPVNFDVTSGNGAVNGSPATTNASGIATLTNWQLGAPGLNTLQARFPSGATAVSFSALATQAPALATILVVVTPATIHTGESATATATGVDQFGAAIATGPVTWASSSDLATVSAAGVVRGASPGQAVVTAAAGGKIGQAAVTVLATPVLTTLSVSIVPATVQAGRTTQATATGFDQFGASIATGPVSWSSSSPVATIAASGVIAGVAAGTATITANTGERTAQALITVTAAPVTRVLTVLDIVLTPSVIVVGGTSQATAIGRDQFGDPFSIGPVSWTTTGSATITSTGLITGVSAGTAQIGAAADGLFSSALLYVSTTGEPPRLTSMSISTPGTTVAAGAILLATVRGRDQSGADFPTGTVVWSASGTAATVSQTGVITGVRAGTSEIRATALNGVFIYTNIVVTPVVTPPPITPIFTSITVTLSANTIVTGQSVQASVQGFDQYGAPIAIGPVSYSLEPTSLSNYVRISASGLVTTSGDVGGTWMVVATSGGKTAQTALKIRASARVTATVAKSTLVVGETTTATITIFDQDDVPILVPYTFNYNCPGGCSGNATVTKTSATTYNITATSPGTVILQARTSNGIGGGFHFATTGVTIVPRP